MKPLLPKIKETVIRMYKKLGNKYILAMAGSIVGVNIVLGSLFLWAFEVGADGALINSYGDAIWMNGMVATTVGFGDVYPVTLGGRIVTLISSTIGIGMFGLFTSIVSGMLMTFASETENVEAEDLHAQNKRIEEKLDRLLAIENQRKVDKVNEYYRKRQ